MTEIFRTIAGSRLYGTDNPDSDTDIKAVHLPTKREILLGRRQQIIHTTSPELDFESFELQKFLKLASDMQTIAVEMLFAGTSESEVWKEILRNRHRILNRNTKAFVGYCKAQANRYSVRGHRLATFEAVCKILRNRDCRVESLVDALTSIENVVVEDNILNVFGRKVPLRMFAKGALDVYERPLKMAGARALEAKGAGGYDAKALYHAVRIADEGIRLFSTGELSFPCENLPLLRSIRAGEISLEAVMDIFDEKVETLQKVIKTSQFRDAPDLEWIDNFVAEVYYDRVTCSAETFVA